MIEGVEGQASRVSRAEEGLEEFGDATGVHRRLIVDQGRLIFDQSRVARPVKWAGPTLPRKTVLVAN